MTEESYEFTGDPTKRPANAHPDSPATPEPYIADDDLKRAVNLAIFLQRPLLLEGEAGCGKTRLARAVAYELGLPYYRWDVRSTSKAQDGLFSYDTVLRLHDVQLAAAGQSPAGRDPGQATTYRRFGELGKAFLVEECRAVVLIDEVDKADLDFPNDLLSVMEKPWEFEIRETGEKKIKAVHPPIIFITSNKEKGNLPAPFLRRCLYYFLKFPDEKRLKEIVAAHYPEKLRTSEKLVDEAVGRFMALRDAGRLHKTPGTSEFLDWLKALDEFRLVGVPVSGLPKEDEAGLLPFPETLFKLRDDWRQMVLGGR